MMNNPDAKAECPDSASKDADGLHSCVSCNPFHHLYQENCNPSLVTDYEPVMANSQEELLVLSPDDSDLTLMETNQTESVVTEVPDAIATSVANSVKPPVHQSLVKTGRKIKLSEDPTLRVMQAKIEELQQTVLTFHNKHHCHEVENKTLRRENMDLRRDIHSKYQQVE